MEDEANRRYDRQPNVFYQKLNLYDAAALAEYQRLYEEYKLVDFKLMNDTRIEIYNEFINQCKDIMLSLTLEDKQVVFNNKTELT